MREGLDKAIELIDEELDSVREFNQDMAAGLVLVRRMIKEELDQLGGD